MTRLTARAARPNAGPTPRETTTSFLPSFPRAWPTPTDPPLPLSPPTLFIHSSAGPVNIHENVMRAMDRPSQNHRDPWFAPFFKQILEDVKVRESRRERA
jgi:hypothetical protein